MRVSLFASAAPRAAGPCARACLLNHRQPRSDATGLATLIVSAPDNLCLVGRVQAVQPRSLAASLLFLSPFTQPNLRYALCFLADIHCSWPASTSLFDRSHTHKRPILATCRFSYSNSRPSGHGITTALFSEDRAIRRTTRLSTTTTHSKHQKLCKILLPKLNSRPWTSDTMRRGFA